MNRDLELWQFVAERLQDGERVMLLLVAASSGSSPGRAGYKMAVGENGKLVGSIGGGVMEVNLVDETRTLLSASPQSDESFSIIKEQIHRKNHPDSSGMICSGKQTIIFSLVVPRDIDVVRSIISGPLSPGALSLVIRPASLKVLSGETETDAVIFKPISDTDFEYRERLGHKDVLYIIGGGHCALALCELMSRLDFHIQVFDDRPALNTIEKNLFADSVTIIEGYDHIAEHIPSGANSYVVVMTVGYRSDKTVISALADRDFRYFGVLGSEAKMKIVMAELLNEGFSEKQLERVTTPIGIHLNSHTPEEIAVSIAAQIISVRNRKVTP